jgi:hypothetical protein
VGLRFRALLIAGAQEVRFETVAKGLALGEGSEKIIEAGGVVLQWAGSGLDAQTFGHGGTPSPLLEHGQRLRPTNYQQLEELANGRIDL